MNRVYQATERWDLGQELSGKMEMVKDCCWYLWDCDIELTVANVHLQIVCSHGNEITVEQVFSHMDALVKMEILK